VATAFDVALVSGVAALRRTLAAHCLVSLALPLVLALVLVVLGQLGLPHLRCRSMLLLCTNLGSMPLTKHQANVLSIGNGLLCPCPLVGRWDQERFIKAKATCNVFDRLRCQDKGKLAQHLHLKSLLANRSHNSIIGRGEGIIQLTRSTHSLVKKEFRQCSQCPHCQTQKSKMMLTISMFPSVASHKHADLASPW